MSWPLKKKARALVEGEDGVVRKDWGGRVSVALVYPNTYAVGMSNLGFQTIYEHLNTLPYAVCERVFFPDPEDVDEYARTGTAPFSLESQRPLTDFDLVGFSITYEGDYINVARLLRMAGLPLRAARSAPDRPRGADGWRVRLLNPEPMAPFMDAIVVGEGEEAVTELIDAYRAAQDGDGESRRRRVIEGWKPLAGVYVPDAYGVAYAADGRIDCRDARRRVRARRGRQAPPHGRQSVRDAVHLEDAEGRVRAHGAPGSRQGLRARLPILPRGPGLPARRVTGASTRCARRWRRSPRTAASASGWSGACVSDYPWIGDLMKILDEYGVEVSISSLRADSLTEDLVASLQRGGHRTLTMAPEAGTERLREVTRKVISDEQLFAACDLLRRYGIPNLKCYFMIGLPTETREDVAAIPDLAERMLERLRVPGPDGHPFGKLTLSVSSFVPKPWTPFQWAAFDDVRSLEEKLEIIKRGARRLSVRVVHENPREAGLQALLARGDRRLADFIEMAADLDGDWRRALRGWDGDPAFYTRLRDVSETFPWDHLDVGVRKTGLLREWQRAGLGEPAAV